MSETRKQQNVRSIHSMGFALEGSHGNKGWNQLTHAEKFIAIGDKMTLIEKKSQIKLDELSQLLTDIG